MARKTDRRAACASAHPSRRTSRAAFAGAEPDADDPLLQFQPYRHRAPRRNSITPERQRAFIAALAGSGIVTQAARSIGASLEALYKLRALPGAEGFATAWEVAIERGLDRLEDCALELALRGEELPIVSGGKLLGTYRKHNFAHIRFVLSQRRAQRYGGGQGTAEPQPGTQAYERLRVQWLAEHEAEQARTRQARFAADDAFLERLNRRLGTLRQEAIETGALRLLPDGRSEWTGDLRRKDAD